MQALQDPRMTPLIQLAQPAVPGAALAKLHGSGRYIELDSGSYR